MSRVYNFSAGPAVLPEEVLKEVAEEMMDYQGSGMSVMEMSHRSADFQKIIDEAEQDLRDLMKIPDNYKVLFLQGGASQQFAAIPMNLMKNYFRGSFSIGKSCPGQEVPYALSMYSPVRVSIRSTSPSLMNRGTFTT